MSEAVVSIDKHLDYCSESLQCSCKASAASGKNRNVVTQVGVDAFNGKRITFAVDTLREAVKALVSRNVLEVHQGSGTFITGNRMGVSEDPLGFAFIKDKRKLVMDLLDMRMAIEPRIASLAAVHATDEDIKRILALVDEVERLILAGENHMEKDIELHAVISESSRNLVVPNLMPIIQHAISLFVNITNQSLRQETIETHRAIAEAIAARDTLAASDAMTLHIIYNRNNMHTLFRQTAETTEVSPPHPIKSTAVQDIPILENDRYIK